MGADDDYERLLGGLTEALTQSEQKSVSELHLVPPLPLQMSGKLDVAVIRRETGLSQPAFASRIGVSLATLRNWEQGHRSPTGPARVLLALVARNPRIVEETLAD